MVRVLDCDSKSIGSIPIIRQSLKKLIKKTSFKSFIKH